jgi:response regulator of citrate/malate metabolism
MLIVQLGRMQISSDRRAHRRRQSCAQRPARGNVIEAKRLLSRNDYRVMLLDVILPDGNGADVIEFIKSQQLPKPEIVIMTAAKEWHLARVDRTMVRTILSKPIDAVQVADYVRDLAAAARAPRV